MTFSRVLFAVIGAIFLVAGASAIAADVASASALAEAVKAKLVAKGPVLLGTGEVEVRGGIATLQASGTVPGIVRVVNRAVAWLSNIRSRHA
jgi:hypothetical protein